MLADLLPLAKEWRPDVLIHEHGELASPLVGAVLGLPSVTHAFGGAIPAGFLGEAGERLASLWREHGQPVAPYAGCFTSLYLDICPTSAQQEPVDHIGDTQPLRPVSDTGPTPATLPDCLEDDGRPLVYVTLGAVRNRSPVLKPAVDALSTLPVRVLATVGPDGDPGLLGAQPAHVRVEGWVNQPQVLQHCTVVVSHAGSGTFLGTLARGLPQLCMPQAADQFRNAAAGARVGAALVLGPDEASADAVSRGVARLLGENTFRDRAALVATEIGEMPSPAEVVDVLVGRFG